MAITNYRRSAALLLVALAFALTATFLRTSLRAETPVAKSVEKPAAESPPASAKTTYLRVVHDSQDRAVSLETAIVSFGPEDYQQGRKYQNRRG